MEDDAADDLDVEVPHADRSPGGLPHDGEGGRDQIVDRRAVLELLLELVGLGLQLRVGEGLHLRLERVHSLDLRHHALEIALVLAAEDFSEYLIQHDGATLVRLERKRSELVCS